MAADDRTDDPTDGGGEDDGDAIGVGRVVVAVIASTFFVGIGGGVVFPVLPNLGDVLGISPFLVGLILSANRFTRIVANAPAGSLVDRVGTRTPLVAGLGVESVGVLGYLGALSAGSPAAWFLGARVFWGVGSALVFATAYTIAADVSDADSRGANMGVIRAGIILGFPAGLVLGGVVSDVYTVETAFALAAACAVVATVIAYAVVPETHADATRGGIAPWEIETARPVVVAGLVNFGLFFAYMGALFATLVLLVKARDVGVFGYGPQGTSGVLMAVTVLAAAGATFAGGTLSDARASRVPVLLGFLATAAVGFLVLAVASSLAWIAAACLVIGAGQGGTNGPLRALIADVTPDERTGRAMGTNNVLGDLGGGFGPIVSLPLVETVGFAPVYAACAVIPLAAGLLLVVGVPDRTDADAPDADPSTDLADD